MARALPLLLAVLLAPACAGGSSSSAGTAGPPASAPGSSADPGGISLRTVATGFDRPVDLDELPGSNGVLEVTDKDGLVRPIDGGRPGGPPLLDIRGQVSTGNEQGLLSIAFHPDFEANGLMYADFTDPAGDTRVVEYHVSDGRADPSSARVLLRVDQPYANHNGGDLVFAPDGRMIVGLGDGGSAGDPARHAQDPSSPLGKLLSIDVDAANPSPQLLALGLRNPWRFSFDRRTGDLWIGDVGQGAWEEVDHLPAGTAPGANFGWSAYEGNDRYNDDQAADPPRLTRPVAVYSHDLGCSITGGVVYRGADVPALDGRYVFADYCSGRAWTLAASGDPARPRPLRGLGLDTPTAFAEDAAGELYVLSDSGSVHRFVTGSTPP